MRMLHGQFFRVTSQIRDYVKNFCNNLNNLFHFACRRWIINQKVENSWFSKILPLNIFFQDLFNGI